MAQNGEVASDVTAGKNIRSGVWVNVLISCGRTAVMHGEVSPPKRQFSLDRQMQEPLQLVVTKRVPTNVVTRAIFLPVAVGGDSVLKGFSQNIFVITTDTGYAGVVHQKLNDWPGPIVIANQIPSDDKVLNCFISAISQHGFQCMNVGVNIRKNGDSHSK